MPVGVACWSVYGSNCELHCTSAMAYIHCQTWRDPPLLCAIAGHLQWPPPCRRRAQVQMLPTGGGEDGARDLTDFTTLRPLDQACEAVLPGGSPSLC